MRSVEIDRARILVDGKAERIISAGMHYFRIHPELWADRIAKAVAFGANAIETYIPWNLHEPEQGQFNFSGIADFERFIDIAQAHGLYVILRPSPYICAEWDNGGLPAWLNAVPGIKMRRMNEAYLEAVSDYYDVLLPKIQKKLYPNGGPVIMLSLENEYGSYCHDKEYLRRMLSFYQKHNITVPIFTNDGHQHFYLSGGALPGTMMTMNFGSHSEEAWRNREEWRPDSPDFCMEFWVGWFDHWGEKHHIRAAGADGSAEEELEKMLKAGAHVNFYMFHGGTNFGFTNGANGHYFSDYAATVSSYDYDSPLSECGDPTEKFYKSQQIIKKYTGNPRIAPIEPTVKIAPPAVKLSASAGLLDNLKVLSTHFGKAAEPPLMEELSQNFGFIHYRKRLDGPLGKVGLRLFHVNDYAQVWLDGHYLGSRMRDDGQNPFPVEVHKEGAVLDILVENCGRINYGIYVGKDFKGITQAVAVEFQEQLDWEYYSLPLDSLDGLEFAEFDNRPGQVRFHRGEFQLDATGDTFLRRPGVKGSVWINGFHLGRYWNIGPTETLYVPAPVLKRGINEIIIMEQEALDDDSVSFQATPDLGETE